jgi:hypothetical protein
MATRDDLIEALEAASNFCRGMALDPAIPQHAKDACLSRSNQIDELVSKALSDEEGAA